MDSLAAARNWRDGWTRAWRAKDPEVVASLYADEAVFLSHPFRQPHLGSAGAYEYAQQAFSEEEGDTEVWFGEPVAAGDRAAVEYWAIITSGGTEFTLAGTTLLRFAPNGLVVSHRDYWSMEQGRLEPPADWGE